MLRYFLFVCVSEGLSYPPSDGGVSLGLGDEVAQQGAGSQEAQADVGGLGEIPQHRGVGEVPGARAPVDQRHHDLDRDDLRHVRQSLHLDTVSDTRLKHSI